MHWRFVEGQGNDGILDNLRKKSQKTRRNTKFERIFAAFLLLFVKGLVILAVATSATVMSPSTHSAGQRLVLDRSRRNRSVLEAVESDSLSNRSVFEAAHSGLFIDREASFLS